MPLRRSTLLSLTLVLSLAFAFPLAIAGVLGAPLPAGAQQLAFVGGTIHDGNGGPPLEDATLLVSDGAIRAVGPRADVTVPEGFRVVDVAGRHLLPGLVDVNTHTSLYGGGETLALYRDRQDDLVLEAAQLHLKHGVTTIRDSYGALGPLTRVRDAIRAGSVVGPRMFVAGNIVGWGGPCSVSYSMVRPASCDERDLSFNEEITQGVSGEEMLQMTPEEVRAAINRYIDLGPDHIRYGATTHFTPAFIYFSLDAQKAIVEEAHRRGLPVETHSTTAEGMRLALLAGVDLLQHPEVLVREVPDGILRLLREREVLCAFRASVVTGDAWQRHLAGGNASPGEGLSLQRANAERLVRSGCIPAVGNDNYLGSAPELRAQPKPDTQEPGVGTWNALEGLVELGLSPAEAIVAATRNGARAAGALDRFGTLEPGKAADLIVLDEDPLADIANVRTLSMVVKEGVIVDRDFLPSRPVWHGHPDL